jgi:hypothetical protein
MDVWERKEVDILRQRVCVCLRGGREARCRFLTNFAIVVGGARLLWGTKRQVFDAAEMCCDWPIFFV